MGVDDFIARWTEGKGGAERANYVLFLAELCDLIGVSRPNPAGPERAYNDYVFERAVRHIEAYDPHDLAFLQEHFQQATLATAEVQNGLRIRGQDGC